MTEQMTAPTDQTRRDNLVIAALCVASFLAALNFFATSPFYAEMADDLDTTVPLLGQVTTAMICISTVLGLFVGPIADRYGYRRPLIIGVLCVAITLAGVGLSPSYPVLLAFSISGGLADALVFGLPLAIASIMFEGKAQRRAMAWTIGSLSSASIVGTPILTSTASFTTWRFALVAAGLATVAAAWFVSASLPADNRRPATPFSTRELFRAYVPLLRHGPTVRLYGTTALRAVTWIGLLTYLGAFLDDEVGLSTRNVGFVYMAGGAGYGLSTILTSRLIDVSSRRIVAASCLASGVAVGFLLQINVVWVVIALIVVSSVAASVTGIGTASILARESPAGTGTTMVLNGSLLNLGSAVGALLGGVLISLGGYRALGIGLPVFAVTAAVLAAWPNRARRVGV
jgi:predicted MFS family arabinose efflux permease